LDERQEVRSLKKGLRALVYLNENGDASVTQVSKAIGVPRTTAHRMLETLTVEGYLERQPHADSYRLTSRVTLLSAGFRDEAWLREAAQPVVSELSRRIRWPMALTTPQLDHMLVRIATDYDTSLAIERYTTGFRTPVMHATTGLCYLAFCPDDEREAVISCARQSDDPRQRLARSPQMLDPMLKSVRRDGFLILEFPEYREGSLGVPVVGCGRVLGGLVMRYIKSALRPDRLTTEFVPLLLGAAKEIESRYRELVEDDRPRSG
jgi:IclR family transcriptional regulator, mhp operon transcriptional activator